MKNKGFMLIETLITSTIVLGALIFLFIQFSSIKRTYENSFKYNTIPGLYKAKEIANFIINDNKTNLTAIDEYITYEEINCTAYSSSFCSKLINKMEIKHMIITTNNIKSLQNKLNSDNYSRDTFDNEKFKEYILSLDDIIASGNRRIIIEYNDNTFATVSITI